MIGRGPLAIENVYAALAAEMMLGSPAVLLVGRKQFLPPLNRRAVSGTFTIRALRLMQREQSQVVSSTSSWFTVKRTPPQWQEPKWIIFRC